MKKITLFLLLTTIAVGCTKVNCKIEGTVKGISSKKVYLEVYENRETKIIDSANVKSDKFLFKLDSVYPQMAYITFEGSKDKARLILEPGKILVQCDFDSVTNYVVSGTPSNDLLTEYNKETREADYRAKFIKEHNNTFAAAYLLAQTSTYGFSVAEVDSLLTILDPMILPNKFKDKLVERRDVLEKTAPVKIAPEIIMPTTTGEEFALSSLRGSTVLIDFWASWCGPCRKANPEVVAIYNKFKDRGFTVLGVSLDTDREKWLEAISADGLTWHQVSDLKGVTSSIVDSYGITGIPHTVLVDSLGRISGTMLSGEELERRIDEIARK